MDNDPNPNKAKMLALLALLDVLEGETEMTTVGTDRVGRYDSNGRGGKIRLRFTVFGDETKLLAMAHELTLAGSHEAMIRMVDGMISRGDKIRFATRMISAWTEVIDRLVSEPKLRELAAPDDSPRPAITDGGTRYLPRGEP